MPEDEGDTLLLAEIGKQLPSEHALGTDDDILAKGIEGFEQRFRLGTEVSVEPDLVLVIDDADVHRSGVQVDAALVGLGAGVESHWGLLPVKSGWRHPAYPAWTLGGRPK